MKSGESHSSKKEEMLLLNKEQKQFYEIGDKDIGDECRGVASKVWVSMRSILQQFRSDIDLKEGVFEKHKEWMGDVSRKKVLDLGCHKGDRMSKYLAKNAGSYIGVDLSESAIDRWSGSISHIESAQAIAIDFLSDDFDEGGFDVVRAQSVFHHFKHLEVFLDKLNDHVAEGAVIVTWDPLQTSPLLRVARAFYRPFQNNAEWEFPFGKQSISLIGNYFQISEIEGILGLSKYAIPLYVVSNNIGIRVGQYLAKTDEKYANRKGLPLWICLQVIMKLENDSWDTYIKYSYILVYL